MSDKYFIITIDTEGDNLWDWKQGDSITTTNAQYLQRFQNLCDKYGFKPVWLSNYEMMMDPEYLAFIKRVEETGTGELGMHLHAWSTPPEYTLPVESEGAPYLIEYPDDIMDEKIKSMTDLILAKTGVKPVSHRSGRWAMNQKYFNLLSKHGYKVDCSVTPYIDWSNNVGQTKGSAGSDYSKYPSIPYQVEINNGSSILETPVTVRPTKGFFLPSRINLRSLYRAGKYMFKGQNLWLRPNGNNRNAMKYLVNNIAHSQDDYIMFMLHSSEFMPGGSPTFKTTESIEILYKDIEAVFALAQEKGFVGITLRDYYYIKGYR